MINIEPWFLCNILIGVSIVVISFRHDHNIRLLMKEIQHDRERMDAVIKRMEGAEDD